MDLKDELMKTFVSTILPAIAMGIVALIAASFSGLTAWIKGRAALLKENSAGQASLNVLARATEMMRSVVAHVNVEMAEPIRAASEDGVITADEAKKLKEQALALFKKDFGEQGMAELKAILGDGVGTWLSGLLERVLVGQKAEAAKAALPEATEPAAPPSP